MSGLVKVSLSDSSACALRRDGAVVCFDLEEGLENASPPVAGKFRDVAGDGSVGAALGTDGAVVTWDVMGPTFPSGTFEQIAFDRESACGIRPDHSIACAGTAKLATRSLPGNYQQLIVAGEGGFCGLTTDGVLRCETTPAWEIQPPVNDLPPLTEVAVDPSGTMGGCGIDYGGALHCWGYYCPISGTFSHVALSYFGACALTTLGQLQCWNYRLARDDCDAAPAAIKLSEPPTGSFTALASSLLKTCAIEAGSQNVHCW